MYNRINIREVDNSISSSSGTCSGGGTFKAGARRGGVLGMASGVWCLGVMS